MPVKTMKPGETLSASKPLIRSSMTLPTKKTVPATNLEAYTMFIYGQPKVGKTTFTMQFQDTLHIMFEPGAKNYSIYERQPEKWEDFKKLIELLKVEKASGTLAFKFFAIDTVDLAFLKCQQYICRQEGLDKPSDGDFGSAYPLIDNEFRDAMIDLAKLGGFIALSHVMEKEVETRGEKYHVLVPSCPPRCTKVLTKWCDLTGYYHLDDNDERSLVIGPTKRTETGNRLDTNFNYNDGSSIIEVKMGSTPEESGKIFMDAFNNSLDRPIETQQEEPKPTEQKPTITLK